MTEGTIYKAYVDYLLKQNKHVLIKPSFFITYTESEAKSVAEKFVSDGYNLKVIQKAGKIDFGLKNLVLYQEPIIENLTYNKKFVEPFLIDQFPNATPEGIEQTIEYLRQDFDRYLPTNFLQIELPLKDFRQ